MPVSGALLEREAELEMIERLLDAVGAGCGGILMIEGEAGAGKTSLLEFGADLAQTRGTRVLRARGGEYERDFAFGVVRQLFEPLLADPAEWDALLSGDAAAAEPIFRLGSDWGAATDPYSAQHGLHHLVVALTAASPLVLAVDDGQWADAASLRALAYIGRRLEALPVGLALTVRRGEPDAPERLLDELRGEPGCSILVPAPLSPAAASALVSGEAGRPADEAFASACCSATAGNPFLLVQLLRALEVEGMDLPEADVDRLAEIAAAGASRSILARLGRLGEHATAVARAVAVLEPNAEVRLIASLADHSPQRVTDACERLVLAGLLSDSQTVGFVHPLVRAAVLGEVAGPRRAADHARAARLLAEAGTGGDTVASHLLLAEPSGDPWAVAELRSAADEALARGAPDSAISYLRRALREPPTREERLDVSRELGTALLRADDPEGIEVLRAVRASLDDPISRVEIAMELSPSIGLRRSAAEAAALLEESLAEVPETNSRLGAGLRSQFLMQALLGLEGVDEGVLPDPDDGVDPGLPEYRLVLVAAAGLYALGLGKIEQGRVWAQRAHQSPASMEADASRGYPPVMALAALLLADREVSLDLFDRLIEASRRRGTRPGVSAGLATRAFSNLFAGRLHDAREDAEAAVSIGEPLQLRNQLGAYTAVLVKTLLAQGELAAAEQHFAETWHGVDPGPGLPGAYLLISRGELRAEMGKHGEARHDFLAAAERIGWLPYANPEILGWRNGLALAESALGNDEDAARLAAEAVSLAREAGGARGIGIALRVQGLVAGGDGTDRLREALEVLEGTRARLQYASVLADLGAALRRANRRRESREPLREALDLAHRFGAVPLEERARAELAATGARPRKAVLSGVESLTASELRVASLAAEGMANREIARALTVSEKTVETHLRHAFQKLEIDRRAELEGILMPMKGNSPSLQEEGEEQARSR
jgi:DNA-binding CsgD family transcriptional regulator